jgi:ABC-type histidine transport system ATPase subunit
MTYKIPENATILSIYSDYVLKQSGYGHLYGLKIITDKGDIVLVIDSESSCCEIFGGNFLETPDDITKYIGATLLTVKDTNDYSLNPSEFSNETQLKITTTKGVLQYAVYNEHNGWYSHSTFLQVFDHTERGFL